MNQTDKDTIRLKQAELTLLRQLRELQFGKMVIHIQNGKAFRYEVIQSTKIEEEHPTQN